MILAFLLTCLSATPSRPGAPVTATLPGAPLAPARPKAPLSITRVVREGLPPFEDDNRLYRLEGEGASQLQPGRIILLHRDRERLTLGRLQVTLVMPGYVLARQTVPGEVFPQRGDLARPQEPLGSIPALPPAQLPWSVPVAASLAPEARTRKAPVPEPGFKARREPIYFLKGESRLSPAGQSKLKTWVQTWGKARRWSLACPPWPEEPLDLCTARLAVLKTELRRLGVTRLDEVILTEEPPGRLPLVYVAADPW